MRWASSDAKVRRVRGARDLKAFIELPYRLHAGDPNWVAPLRFEVRSRLSRRQNPFFEHAEADYFLARRGREVVGRIAAIANRLHDEIHDDGAAFFGFLECVNDAGVAGSLFEAAAEWAASRGYRVLRGPMSFSINDECGLLVDGFDTPPSMMMPHNPPYYGSLVEAAGFHKAKDLWVYQGPSGGVGTPERLTKAVDRLRRKLGVTMRSANRRDFLADVRRLRDCYNAVWSTNWGFVPMTDNEVRHMARQLRPFYVPSLVPFVEKDGRVIGVGLAIPDLNEALRRNRSGRLLPGLLQMLWAMKRRKLRRMRVLLLGVLPEYRGKAVDAMLWHWIWSHCVPWGIRWAEAGWVLEDNPAMINAMERMRFHRYKTYRLYDRPL